MVNFVLRGNSKELLPRQLENKNDAESNHRFARIYHDHIRALSQEGKPTGERVNNWSGDSLFIQNLQGIYSVLCLENPTPLDGGKLAELSQNSSIRQGLVV